MLLHLRRVDPLALHRQLEQELRSVVRSGRLQPGVALPSSRTLARQLGVSRGVGVEAYEQLTAEGYLIARPRSATRVAAWRTEMAPARAEPTPATLRYDFRPGTPDLGEFPRDVWLRCLRRTLGAAPSLWLGYGSPAGVPELRSALAAYLNRVRGAAVDPGRVVVTSGFAQGLGLVSGALRSRGARHLAVEDPSHAGSREIALRAGLTLVGIAVDDDGLSVEALRRTSADAVLVTPAHQFPTGAVLGAERRAALVDWAREHDALIIEDDYDAEFRYDREPIGAIQGLAPDRVVYAGTASKTLVPGLRLGWLAVPGWLATSVAAAKEAADLGSPALEQLALAEFLDSGELDRHLRRLRHIYRRRRDVLLAALERHLPDLQPMGSAADLHLLALLPPELGERLIVKAAASVSVGVYGLAGHSIKRVPGRGGLVFGYGGMSESDIDEGVRLLATAMS